MSIYADLKIRNKLIIGYALVLFCCCLIGFAGFWGMSKIKSSLDGIHNNLIPAITTVAEIDCHTMLHQRAFLLYLLEKGKEQRKKQAALLHNEENQTIEALEQMEKSRLLPNERKLLTELSSLCREYFNATAKIRVKADSRLNYEMPETEKEYLFVLYDKLETVLEQLSQINTHEAGVYYTKTTLTYLQLRFWLLALIICSILLAVMTSLFISRSISKPLIQVLQAVSSQQEKGKEKARLIESIVEGDLNQDVLVTEPLKLDKDQITRDETGMLLGAIAGMSEVQYVLDQAFVRMTNALRENQVQETQRNWSKNGQHELNLVLRGDKPISELTEQVLVFITEYLGAGIGVFYVFDDKEKQLQIAASYAFAGREYLHERIALGEGLAGQAALERKMICLDAAPADYLQINSGLGEADPVNIVVLPLLYNDDLVGLLEIGSFKTFRQSDLDFLEQSMDGIAIALSVNRSRQLVNELLEQTQEQTEELQVQQEELQQTNEELEERAQMLEQQREQIRIKNCEVMESSRELQRKADELERVSAFKSEFLANMSHELRTPLNSLMILSSLLKDNREGNLTNKQVEFAATINGAGRDLLNLINDILDLSKIESGHMDFYYEDFTLSEICQQLETIFHPISGEKEIGFSVIMDESTPQTIIADGQRTLQILKNLLSNACKFTSKGEVSLRVYTPDPKENPLEISTVAFAVTDTGIGIPNDKQLLVFNAFQQGDGSTSRTYGGTGLGLSISRRLARSMGGEISLISEEGKGSRFILYLPVKGEDRVHKPAAKQSVTQIIQPKCSETATSTPVNKSFEPLPAPIPDDRELIRSDVKSILIVEDDLTFAAVLLEMVRGRGFYALIAADGESGISLAELYQPSAIILDIMLPHIDGWGVMRSLKDNPKTRHIPVHFITCMEERQKAMGMGAIGFVTKPVSSEQLDSVFGTLEAAIEKTMKMLLIVEDDQNQAKAMVALLEERDVTIRVADSGDKAIEFLTSAQFDCVVLDLGLADMGAFELLEELKKLDPGRRIPVIIHTGQELTHEDEKRLHRYAESIIIKGAKSPERLLNEVTLFLHLVETSLDPGKQRMIRAAMDKEAMLDGKRILIVDDDMRNIFSLSSALSEKNMIIHEAENGREALRQLDLNPDTDLVLMDIMMPEMDGYEAMRKIRADNRFQNIPIIALTAKAMKGDREECLKAGASDYIPKPVDMEKLFSLLRVWLYSAASSDTVSK